MRTSVNDDVIPVYLWRSTVEQVTDGHTLTMDLFEQIVAACRTALNEGYNTPIGEIHYDAIRRRAEYKTLKETE
jgi:hypothetical protein